MTPDEQIADIKREAFDRFKGSRQVWIVEEIGADFRVHYWTGDEWKNGAGVSPQHDYPTLRKAAARLLQLFGVGAVSPQTWPERVCIGEITMEDGTQRDPLEVLQEPDAHT